MKLGLIGGSNDRTSRSGVYKPSDNLEYVSKAESLEHYVWRRNWNLGSFFHVSRPKLTYGDNGYKLYISDGTIAVNAEIRQFDLTTPYDQETASYSGKNINVNYVASELNCSFSNDGTVMYLSGSSNTSNYHPVTTYDLSTAWDISTASPRVKTLYLGQTLTSEGIYVKPDGSSIYVCGSSGDDVDQYDMSTAWDLNTASYTQRFSVAGQETAPHGVEFKPDGTKMYIIGQTGDDVNEYNLSTAWDISTASYSQSFSVAAQATAPTGVRFKADGAKMYISNHTNTIYEYNLSTAWDVSTASYSQLKTVAESTLEDLAFSSDGTKMYVCGRSNDGVIQYDLSTAWDISTASLANNTLVLVENPNSIFVANNDSYLFICSNYINVAYRYTMKTPGEVSQLDGVLLADATTKGYGRMACTKVTPDGSSFILCHYSYIVQYSLSTPFELHTATKTNTLYLPSVTGESFTWDGHFSEDGTSLYLVGNNNRCINRLIFTTLWDISTLTIDMRRINLYTSIFGAQSYESLTSPIYYGAGPVSSVEGIVVSKDKSSIFISTSTGYTLFKILV